VNRIIITSFVKIIYCEGLCCLLQNASPYVPWRPQVASEATRLTHKEVTPTTSQRAG